MDGSDWPRLVYTVLLLLFLGSGLFWYYRGRLNAALQNAAIWVLIFLGVTLAYGLREPLAVALNLQPAVIGDEIVLTRQSDGHFFARLEVNGTTLPFIIDTGASEIVLSQDAAAQAGIDPATLRFTGIAQTANGTVRLAPVRLETLRFGEFVDENIRATVNGGEMNISLLGKIGRAHV